MANLSTADLVKVRDLVLQDSVAITKWGQIVDSVITLAADEESMKAKLRGQDPNYAEAVLQTLKIWNSYGNELRVKLLDVLETYDLISLADKIRALEFQSTNSQGESAQNSNPGPSSTSGNGCLPLSSPLPSLAINFVERKSKLKELHELVTRPCGLNKSAYALLTGLYGLGGIGKTTLARRYVDYFKHKDRFPGASVFWIESETNSTLRIAFRHLAKTLGVPEFDKLDTKMLAESVYERVYSLTCLFVFDNVSEYDGPDGIYTFLPHPTPGPHHYILATSRKADLLGRVDPNDRILQLDVLSEDEADELVRKALPNSLSTPRQELFTRLGRLPLALQQAIAYIFYSKGAYENESSAIEAYLREFNDKDRKAKLLQSEVLNEEGRKNEETVYLTWQTTLATIAKQKHGNLAVSLLRAMSYMNPDNIDLKFIATLDLKFTFFKNLKEKALLNMPRVIRDSKTSVDSPHGICYTPQTNAIRAAAVLLSKYSMVTLQEGIVSVHRLVQDVVRLTVLAGNANECILLFRIISHIYKCRQAHIDQCVLHGSAVVSFYGKYTQLKKHFPDFAGLVFEEKRLLRLVLNKLSTKNSVAALKLIVNLKRNESLIDSAITCISGMENRGALQIYVGTLSKILQENLYSPTQALGLANWLVVISDTSDTISSLIFRLLPFLDRSALSLGFFCELMKAGEQEYRSALGKLQQYGIDIKSVRLPTKNQIQENWRTYSADLKTVLKLFGDSYTESGHLNEEVVLHGIHIRQTNWISKGEYDTLRSCEKYTMAIVDVLLDCVQSEYMYAHEYKSAIQIANILNSEPEVLMDALKFKYSCTSYNRNNPSNFNTRTRRRHDSVVYNFPASMIGEFGLTVPLEYVNWIVARAHAAPGHRQLADALLFLDESNIHMGFLTKLFCDELTTMEIWLEVRRLSNLKLICQNGDYAIAGIEIPVFAKRGRCWTHDEWTSGLHRVLEFIHANVDSTSNAELREQCILHGCYIYNHVNIPEELELGPELGVLLTDFRKKLKPYADQIDKTRAIKS